MMYEIKEFDLWKDKPEKLVYKFDAEGKKWVYLILRKGCIAGEHWHKGITKVKNPEENIILKGKLEYSLKHVETGEKETFIVEGPKLVKIYPNVYHELKAIEETMFLEAFDEESGKIDRFELEKK